MLFEISNPSDAYTIEADSFEVAAMAVLLLGQGNYGVHQLDGPEDDRKEMPIMIIATEKQIEEWCQDNFGASLADCILRCKAKIPDVLDTVLIGSEADRATYHKALSLIDDSAKKEQWKAEWHDKRRSSMNNIGARAWAIAAKLRKQEASATDGG